MLAGAAPHVAVVPSEMRIWPLEPIPRRPAVFVPVPRIKSPVDVIGDRALNAAEAVVWPVPPEAIGNVPVVRADVDVA